MFKCRVFPSFEIKSVRELLERTMYNEDVGQNACESNISVVRGSFLMKLIRDKLPDSFF